MRMIWIGAVLAGSLLTACNFQATLPKSDPALNAEAEATFGDLVGSRDDAILARMSSANDRATVGAQLPVLRKLTGDSPPPKAKVTGFQSVTSTEGRFYSVAQEYAYPDRLAHVQTTFIKEGEAWKVMSFNVNVVMKAPSEPTEG
mgnify:CR=1 FL=1|jgi:hypothetical protein